MGRQLVKARGAHRSNEKVGFGIGLQSGNGLLLVGRVLCDQHEKYQSF